MTLFVFFFACVIILSITKQIRYYGKNIRDFEGIASTIKNEHPEKRPKTCVGGNTRGKRKAFERIMKNFTTAEN